MFKHVFHAIALTASMSASSLSFAQQVPPNVYTPAPKPNEPAQPPADPDKEARQRERQEERRREREQEGKAGVDLPASFVKASELMGLRVDAKGGEKIGEIKNLAINTDNGRIRYAIVDNGSGTLYPIPMAALKFAGNRQKAVVDTDTTRMKDAPTFMADGWNTIGDTNWGAVVYQFYGINRNAEDDKDRPDFVPANAVVGGKVASRKGDNLGSVKNLMVDTEKNVVAYAVLDFGRDAKLFAVPWQAMTVKDGGKNIVIRAVERDDLKDASGFPNSRWPTYKDLGWDKNTNFDSRPPEWIYGYKNVEGGGNGGGGGGGDNSGDRGAMGGWQTNGKYGQLFKPKAIESFSGRIVRSETVTPLSGMLPGTALIIRSDRGGNVVVHLGPEWFLKHQQDVWKAEDVVEVTGSKVDVDQKPVIMATRIRFDGRSMTLRDENGVPAWDSWQERKR